MRDLKVQECLEVFKNGISAKMAGDGPGWLKRYFKLSDPFLLESWLSGKKIPTGLNMIKMAYYLHRNSFPVVELASATPTIILVIKILANDIATPREATDAVGYKEESDLYKVLLGKRGYSDKAYNAMQLVIKQYSSKIAPSEMMGIPTHDTSTALPTTPCPNQDQLTIDLLHTIGSIGVCLEPLLKKLTESTPEERQNFRTSLGTDERGLFQMSNAFYRVAGLMNALCSEKSLGNFISKTKKPDNHA